ncbi:hypothetical protein GCM10009804_58410 [Kribbella hippodromi]|uniref:Uncharacterized protein n=1 Tax=Kribbella hippodromi TaxID=434347 RepID=A0ABN2E4V3_9ACTN
MRCGFYVAEADVADSPTYERVILLPAVALLEAFGITVSLVSEPEHVEAGGFASFDRTPCATWFDGPDLCRVGTCMDRSPRAAVQDVGEEMSRHPMGAGQTSRHRLEATANCLNISWP